MSRVLSLRLADDASWLVHADELMARGDPRGELIRLQIARDLATGHERDRLLKAERALLTRHRDALLGQGGVLGTLNATWRRGYIVSAHSPTSQAMRVLLSHPSGALLDELILDNPHLQMDEQVEAVGRSRHRTLRVVTVRTDGGATRFEGRLPLHQVFSLPALEVLSAHVRDLDLGSRPGESGLVQLELSARAVALAALGEWSLPRLRELDVSIFAMALQQWMGRGQDVAVEWPELAVPERLCTDAFAPALEVLTLRQYDLSLEAAQRLRRLAESHRLRLLDLTGCRLEPAARSALQGARVAELRLPA